MYTQTWTLSPRFSFRLFAGETQGGGFSNFVRLYNTSQIVIYLPPFTSPPIKALRM